MHSRMAIAAAVAAALVGALIARAAFQGPSVIEVTPATLREYAGVYQWSPADFLYLQLWNELTAKDQLVAFDESGEVRVLYPTARDRFFAGPGAAVSSSVESRIEFRRDDGGRIVSLTWRRGGQDRTARRVPAERHDDVRFSNGGIHLAGTLYRPATGTRHPAVILVHGSEPATREWTLPFARFLIRRGVAVLGYDKRGVGGSGGDWNAASFDDLAGDVAAAFQYLQSRHDIDASQIGLLGVSLAGWIMPIAAVRAPGIAFLISISGAGVPVAETTIDHAANEMTAQGMKPENVQRILELMRLQYRFAGTGAGWDEYVAGRAALSARLGAPPRQFPATREDPHWPVIRRTYLYDPAPTLRRLMTPTLALFGELDNNILAEKNRAAWEAALQTAGNRDYALRIIPKANHIHLEAEIGNNREMPTLRRFAPAYFTTIRNWLAPRLRGFINAS